MWKLYDRLIEEITTDICVDHIHIGETWTIVRAGPYCGIAITVNEQNQPLPSCNQWVGQKLSAVASLCKSWNFFHASVGTAALNAFYNAPDRVFSIPGISMTRNAFTDYAHSVKNKKAAIVGHFTNLERFLTGAEVVVLERRPKEGDYPDSACEYLLPLQDYTFITGSAFVNKTLPRLLELSSGGQSIVLGPSTPMSPVLFEYGADELSGLALTALSAEEIELVGCGHIKMTDYGQRIRLKK